MARSGSIGIPFKAWKILVIAFSMVFLGAMSVCAQNIFVRADATGAKNGSDWNNAYTSLPASLTRGATYYVADGAYGSYTFNAPASGTALIKVKKATLSDHGTDTGWQNSYGDGVAAFGAITFSTSYWVFDGQVGGGPYSWNSGHGFNVYSTSSNLVTLYGKVSDVSIKHTKIYSNRGTVFLSGIKATTGSCDNITVSYCEISNVFGTIFHISNWTNSTIEYSYLYNNKSTAAWHSEGISSIGTNENIVIRHNLWDSIYGTAVFAGVNNGSSNNWQIYGNIFSRSVTTIYYYWEDSGTNKNSMNNSKFFNNTIIGIGGVSQGALIVQHGSGNTAYNNIYYNNDANSFFCSFMHNYTYADLNVRSADCSPPCDKDSEVISGESNGVCDAGNPFENYSLNPLTANLKANTPSGYNTSDLLPGNSYDMYGNLRGSGGTWSRGAIELSVGTISTPVPVVPSPPSKLRLLSLN